MSRPAPAARAASCTPRLTRSAPREAERREHLDHVGGHVGARRVDHLAEVAERQVAHQRAAVVGVERAPAAVGLRIPSSQLHARGRSRRWAAVRLGMVDAYQRQHDLGRVVDVGVVVVCELERPAAGREPRPAHRPVAGVADLLGRAASPPPRHSAGCVSRHARVVRARSAPAPCPRPATGRPRGGAARRPRS